MNWKNRRSPSPLGKAVSSGFVTSTRTHYSHPFELILSLLGMGVCLTKEHIMEQKSDFHTHISVSSLPVMVRAAHTKGVTLLGISEHLFHITEARHLLSHLAPEGTLFSFDEYQAAIRAQ